MTLLALPSLADLALLKTEKTDKHECGSFPYLFKQKRGNTERQQMNGGIKPVDDKWRQCRNVCLNLIHQGTALVNQNNEAFWEKKKEDMCWGKKEFSFPRRS